MTTRVKGIYMEKKESVIRVLDVEAQEWNDIKTDDGLYDGHSDSCIRKIDEETFLSCGYNYINIWKY